MSGVNIFGEPLSVNKKNIIQRGPPGIGFKYLDAAGNFDIDKKRLANVADPFKHYDAVNKQYLDNEYKRLWDDFETFRLAQYAYIDALNKLRDDYGKFKVSDDDYKEGLKGKIETIESFQNGLYSNQTMLETKVLGLESTSQLTLQNKRHFERLGQMLETDYMSVERFQHIMTERIRIFDASIKNVKTELSSQITKGYDELTIVLNEVIEELADQELNKPKSANNSDNSVASNKRKVDLDVETNSGNINILQNDIQDLKGELDNKNIMIASMNREVGNLTKRLEDMEIEALGEGIEENSVYDTEDESPKVTLPNSIDEGGVDTVN